MAEFPALPLWTDAYLADTTHLTTIEHGAYLLLLMAMWRSKECRLPNNDKLLAKYAGLTAGQWARVKPSIWSFFQAESDGITQGRLTDEAELVRRNSRKQSDNSRSRWLKNKGTGDAAGLPDECQTDAPTPTPLPTPTVGSGVERADDSVLPAVAIIQAFDAARIQHFGPEFARPWPTATDKLTAQRWLDAGADIDLCRDVFSAGFARKASARDGPPDSLKFFEKSISNAIAERQRPMPEGKPNAQQPRNRHQYDPDEARRSTLAAFPDLMGGGG